MCVSRSSRQSGTNFNINVYQWVGTKKEKHVWIIQFQTDIGHNTAWLSVSADCTQGCTELKSMMPPAWIFCRGIQLQLHSVFIWFFFSLSRCGWYLLDKRQGVEQQRPAGQHPSIQRAFIYLFIFQFHHRSHNDRQELRLQGRVEISNAQRTTSAPPLTHWVAAVIKLLWAAAMI